MTTSNGQSASDSEGGRVRRASPPPHAYARTGAILTDPFEADPGSPGVSRALQLEANRKSEWIRGRRPPEDAT